MFVLQRMTIQYIAVEDRIRIAGELGDGSKLSLWLTQRMLGLLVPAFTGWLEDRAERHIAHASVMSFEQEAARAALQPQAPVDLRGSMTEWLVQSVDISRSQEVMQIVFKGATDDQRTGINLTPLELRQWLSILQEQGRAGGWTTLVWPDWMQAEPEAATASASWFN